MKIVHRVSISADSEMRSALSKLGIGVNEGLITFEVDEGNNNWPSIEAWIKKRNAVDIIRTHFSKKEIADAKW